MFSLPRTQASRNWPRLRRQRAELDQVLHLEGVLAELPDGQRRARDRQRRDDGVDARAVGQARVDHRRGLVDAAADAADDLVDDAQQVRVVDELGVRDRQLAAALDVDLVRAVDHQLGHGLVAQERLERAVAEDVVGDLAGDLRALLARQRRLVDGERLRHGLAHALGQLAVVAAGVREQARPEARDDLVVDARLELGERVDDPVRRLLAPDVATSTTAAAAARPRGRTGCGSGGTRQAALRSFMPEPAGRRRAIRLAGRRAAAALELALEEGLGHLRHHLRDPGARRRHRHRHAAVDGHADLAVAGHLEARPSGRAPSRPPCDPARPCDMPWLITRWMRSLG